MFFCYISLIFFIINNTLPKDFGLEHLNDFQEIVFVILFSLFLILFSFTFVIKGFNWIKEGFNKSKKYYK